MKFSFHSIPVYVKGILCVPVVALAFFLFSNHTPPAEMMPGVVFEVETTYHSGTPSVENSEMSVEGKMLKMSISSSENKSKDGEMIFRPDKGIKGQMTAVDHEKKTYVVYDPTEMEEAFSEMNEQMKKLEKEMANMPPGIREKILEAQKNGGMPGMPGMAELPKQEIRKTAERGTKNGYPCVKYEVLKDGKVVQELWVTDWSNIDGGGEAQGAFKGLVAFLEKMMENMPGGPNPFNETYNTWSEVDGFPVLSKDFENESESLLKSATRRQLDPADFEPPAGYKRQEMFNGR